MCSDSHKEQEGIDLECLREKMFFKKSILFEWFFSIRKRHVEKWFKFFSYNVPSLGMGHKWIFTSHLNQKYGCKNNSTIRTIQFILYGLGWVSLKCGLDWVGLKILIFSS